MGKSSAYRLVFCLCVFSILHSYCGKSHNESASSSEISEQQKTGVLDSEVLVPVPKDDKWGFIDRNGQWVIDPQFDYAGEFEDGFAMANIGGKFISRDNFIEWCGWQETPAGGKWGFINKSGQWIINPLFDAVGMFIDGLASACVGGEPIYKGSLEGGKWGFIDKTGKWIISPLFDGVGQFEDGWASACTDKKPRIGGLAAANWGFIDKTGKWAIEPKFDYVSPFKDGLANARTGEESSGRGLFRGGKVGYIDRAGKWAIDPLFDNLSEFHDGLAIAGRGGKLNRDGFYSGSKYGLIDRTGQWVIKAQFDEARLLEDGLFIVKTNVGVDPDKIGSFAGGKYGVINKTGEWVIRPQFDEIGSSHVSRLLRSSYSTTIIESKLIAAKIGGSLHPLDKSLHGGKWGFIDKSGKWIINPQFDNVGCFQFGIAPASVGGRPNYYGDLEESKWGIIDATGKWVVNPQFYEVELLNENLVAICVGVGRNSKWGFIDVSGQVLAEPQYDYIPIVISEFFRVKSGGNSSIYNSYGKRIWNELEAELENSQEEGEENVGTGFYVSSYGHLITNAHVIHKAKKIRVSGQSAEILNEDYLNDLALLKVSAKPAAYATFSRSTDVKVGEDICTFGFPLAGLLSSTGNLSVGTVSSLSGIGNNVSQMQVSVPVQPGNSGSPLLNKKGHVIGVLVAKLDLQTLVAMTGQIPENVNFAINAMTIKAFLDFNSVPYKRSGWLNFRKSNEKIAAEAQKYTVKIECFR